MKKRGMVLLWLGLWACEPMMRESRRPEHAEQTGPKNSEDEPKKEVIVKPIVPEEAPEATPRLPGTPESEKLEKAIQTYFEGHVGRRIYVQLDKPLYRPGETIWIKSWDLRASELKGIGSGIRYELISPKGAAVLRKTVTEQEGMATNDFELPADVQGGQYKLRVITFDGITEERPLVVSTYEPPRIKKKLEFIRKAYGAGDEVSATIKIERPTGEPFANHPIEAAIFLDGENLTPAKATTNPDGGAVLRFVLPKQIERGDGLLTVMVNDGGVTESISKRIPIVLKKLQFSTFPEGGQLVAGLESRLYFEAKNTIGKPADVEGKIVDDRGNAVATFTTYHQGLGRVSFTPATGRKYQAEITKPVGISERYALPLANEEGIVLRAFDDLDGERKALRVEVRSSKSQRVVVAALLREKLIDAAVVDVQDGTPAVVYLEPKDAALAVAPGVARVTVFDEQLNPLAERVVFRNRRRQLEVKIESDQASYTPREQVALTVRTSVDGTAVPAEVALAVVDDTVLSFADDKTGHMLSKVLLESEVPGEIEEPNFYFDLTKEKSALALDLLLGTRGYRRFEWQPLLAPPPPEAISTGKGRGMGALGGIAKGMRRPAAPMMVPEAAAKKDGARPMAAAKPQAQPVLPAAAPPPPAPPVLAEAKEKKRALAKNEAFEAEAPARARKQLAADEFAEGRADRMMRDEAPLDDEVDADWPGAGAKLAQAVEIAPVRVFPAPNYSGAFSGVRTDFRETIHWAPAVKTDSSGKAIVTFFVSDAVTSFRATAEGVGGGRVGRSEKVIKSSLPFSMNVKLPLEVSAGDQLELPLTLTNDKKEALPLSLSAKFGDLLKLTEPVSLAGGKLAPEQRASLFYKVDVVGDRGKTKIEFSAEAGGLVDRFERELEVVPVGFPLSIAENGTLSAKEALEFDLGQAVPGSAVAKLTVYTSPTSTLLSGIDGMIQEPYGCFEQTSSTNYPNVMIMDYLKNSDSVDPALVERVSGVLDRGYKRLVGFETDKKGFEWFGRAPAHEALTAYGVLEFLDMKRVYGGVDDRMIERTVEYLKGRRDGEGGFKRDAQALDSFGRASKPVTDAYIVYSLTLAGFAPAFKPEVEASYKNLQQTDDPYLLALAAGTMLEADPPRGKALTKRLAGMVKDGHWEGKTHSITYSTGINLHVETTALAVLALLSAGGYDTQVRGGIDWLLQQRSAHGSFGATQATVLALRALTEYAKASRMMPSAGAVTVKVNGQEATTVSYQAGQKDPLVFEGLGRFLKSGTNQVEILHQGSAKLPYTLGVEFRSAKPASHPDTVVALETTIAKTALKMGETVRVTAKLRNKTAQGQPMTLVRVGIPGGLQFQTWQLKELMDKGEIAFYETRAREVIVYLRQLAPNEAKEIPIDLLAVVAGSYVGPASSSYLYYTNDQKVWVDPLKVTIGR